MNPKGTPENLIKWEKGESGNPKGKPKGTISWKTRISKQLLKAREEGPDSLDEVVAGMIEKAKAGDVQRWRGMACPQSPAEQS